MGEYGLAESFPHILLSVLVESECILVGLDEVFLVLVDEGAVAELTKLAGEEFAAVGGGDTGWSGSAAAHNKITRAGSGAY